MNLIIDLDAESESRLRAAATRRGVKPEAYVKHIIEEYLPAIEVTKTDQTTLDLLARWDSEDATSDPVEIAARRLELDEFKNAVNANRLAAEGPDSRKIYP